TDQDDLEVRSGDVYRRGTIGEAPLVRLAALAAEGSAEGAATLEAVGRFRPDKLTYTYGTHVAHVAVDPETGRRGGTPAGDGGGRRPRGQSAARARPGDRGRGAGAERDIPGAACVRRSRSARDRDIRGLRDADEYRLWADRRHHAGGSAVEAESA